MREQTADLIRRMKSSSFGVEIEMNHITRQRAAQTVAELFERYDWGDVLASEAHEGIRPRQVDNGEYKVTDPVGRTWAFRRDSSIEGSDDRKCELITPILYYEADMKLLQAASRALRHAGARSSASGRCGVHVHISGEGHTVRSLRNLVNLMASHEQQLIRAIGISDERMERYCKTVDPAFLERLARDNPLTMEGLKACWYNGEQEFSRYSPTRYHMLYVQ